MISHMISYMIYSRPIICQPWMRMHPSTRNGTSTRPPFSDRRENDQTEDPGTCLSLVISYNCTLCSSGCQGPEYSADHTEVSLVYFSTFEPINLTPNSVMQKAGVPMLYDTASNPRLPSLYICPVANVLGPSFPAS